ncbi:HAMP domain-containing sensor histidine kinase [Paenibacillus cymbidii]|uniref:HAMP domain-containing sensor histidine kinase n=1 Tax=Paenibacillus cymbidii TaxID=1639034 RepID=UPI001080AC3E|nr:HAMP domain-containing sensor histidine kinase [Paenibacillus cymbidii]
MEELRRNVSMRQKIVLIFTLVIIVLAFSFVGFDFYTMRKTVEETYVSQLDGIATAINGRYEEAHSAEDVQQLFDYLRRKNEKLVKLTLIGKGGAVLASTDSAAIGAKPPTPDMAELLERRQNIVSHIKGDNGNPQVRLLAPMFEGSTAIGAVEVFLDSSHEETIVNKRGRLLFIVACFVILVAIGSLSLVIQRLLISPLLILRKSAIAVQHGERHVQLSLNSASREINELSDAFRDMVHKLESRYEELQNAQKQLVQSEKMVALGSLVAGISHEINTPVGIGVTAVSFLDQKTNEFAVSFRENKVKRSDVETYLRTIGDSIAIIRTNLQRASDLVRSFKQVSVDQSSEARRTFRVKEYLEEVLLSLHPRLKKTHQQVVVDCDESIEITSFPGAISQIVTNLLMNSLTHAYEPDDEGTIRIAVARSGDKLTFRYSDDGKGMEPDVASKMFDPFFTTNRGGGGTGLGMHIVYNLATQTLGGTIHCESERGVGTTVTIEFSVAKTGGASALARKA